MAAVCVAIFCLGQKGTRKKIFFYAGYWLEWFWGNNYQVEKREKVKFTDMDYDCIMIICICPGVSIKLRIYFSP